MLLLVLIACDLSAVDNPTGDCEPEGDGSHLCYSSATDQYLPDCAAPLSRELYRVFAADEATAYVIPRPDATGLSLGICDGDDADLADLFDRNGLCVEVADPDVVNSMTPADALAITHTLHERLDFTAEGSGDDWWVSPFAPDGDHYDACALTDAAALDGYCAELIATLDAGECPQLASVFSEEQAAAMAAALDALYGS